MSVLTLREAGTSSKGARAGHHLRCRGRVQQNATVSVATSHLRQILHNPTKSNPIVFLTLTLDNCPSEVESEFRQLRLLISDTIVPAQRRPRLNHHYHLSSNGLHAEENITYSFSVSRSNKTNIDSTDNVALST